MQMMQLWMISAQGFDRSRSAQLFYNFSFHSEWSGWLSDGQGPARRQEEGTRPWQVQVSLPGWLFELTLVWGAYIELCICRTTLRISNQQTSSSREHCWSFKPAAWSAPTYPTFRLAVVQNKLLGPVIYRQIMSFTTQSRDYPFDKVFFFYRDRDGKAPEVLKIYGQVFLLFVIQTQINQSKQERKDIGCGFAEPDIKIPGSLKTFTVLIVNLSNSLNTRQNICRWCGPTPLATFSWTPT